MFLGLLLNKLGALFGLVYFVGILRVDHDVYLNASNLANFQLCNFEVFTQTFEIQFQLDYWNRSCCDEGILPDRHPSLKLFVQSL